MKRLLNLFMVLCLSIIGGSVLASTAGVSFGVGALGVGALYTAAKTGFVCGSSKRNLVERNCC